MIQRNSETGNNSGIKENLMCLSPGDNQEQMSPSKTIHQDKEWLNVPIYESPAEHTYPKNPFVNDRNAQSINYALQPGAFNVGIKFG